MLSINESRCVNCGACVRACPMGIFQLRKGAVRVGTQRHCILCYHCSAACPRQAIELEGISHEAFYPPKPQAPVQELVRSKRRAIRHFTDKLPEKGQLLSALEGAEYAPSAKNRRPYRWAVLYGREQTVRARDLTVAWSEISGESPELLILAAKGMDLVTCGAACLLVLLIPKDDFRAPVDAAAVMTTTELLLVDQGLATCWAGYFNRACADSPDLRALVGVEEGWTPACSLMVGYPDRERYPNLPYRPLRPVRWVECERTSD